jgi:hypothetical protein
MAEVSGPTRQYPTRTVACLANAAARGGEVKQASISRTAVRYGSGAGGTERRAYLTAKVLMAQYGDDALTVAIGMVARMLSRGDDAALKSWLRIKLAVADLQSRPSGPLH